MKSLKGNLMRSETGSQCNWSDVVILSGTGDKSGSGVLNRLELFFIKTKFYSFLKVYHLNDKMFFSIHKEKSDCDK